MTPALHTAEELAALQALPLDQKIRISVTRIIEWYTRNNGNVYVSFSGGKDSTVLLHLVRRIYPDIPAVFVDTGLEYPEIRQFVKSFENVTLLRPKMMFTDVVSRYGYPILSKEIAEAIHYARKHNSGRADKCPVRRQMFMGVLASDAAHADKPSLFDKQKYLPVVRDLPVVISHYCCNIMKKNPAHAYAGQSQSAPIIGTMTEESRLRKQAWLKHGCNVFEGRHTSSQPLSFWTEQDILSYTKEHGLQLAAPYGDIVSVDASGNVCDGNCECCKLKTTGADRTGCIFCGFGLHNESKKDLSRFQSLALTHPKQYDYCIGGGQWVDNPHYEPGLSSQPDKFGWVHWNPKKIWVPSKEGLGMGKVFDMCNEIYGKDFMRYQ